LCLEELIHDRIAFGTLSKYFTKSITVFKHQHEVDLFAGIGTLEANIASFTSFRSFRRNVLLPSELSHAPTAGFLRGFYFSFGLLSSFENNAGLLKWYGVPQSIKAFVPN